MTLLICDDAMFMRMMLKNLLSDTFDEIIEAENGLKGVEMYKAHHPDIVLMDITMPEMTGLEAVSVIREYDPKAKIIMCSAMGQQSMVLQAIKNGACNFIVKPFEKSKLMEAIRSASSM